MKSLEATRDQVLEWLSDGSDPEIPVLNIVEMGIVRGVEVGPDAVRVDITPTYSGCPAMDAIEQEIVGRLRREGFSNPQVRRVHATPWSSDWLTEGAREKLRRYGIAPPQSGGSDDSPSPNCPFCGSKETELRSFFGSTACKALHFCRACQQPFEKFKEI